MERVYYSINESLAKTAHDMMSMRDYEKDSKTKEYRSYVDKAYDLADKIVAEGRLKQLKEAKEKGTQETEFEMFKVVENTEIMRLQIIFDGKPDPEVRTVLKKNGFKWAPSQGAWQRMLNQAGKYALNRVKEELEVMQNDN